MKNLYEQLQQPTRDLIDKEYETYPALTESLITRLKQTKFSVDLSIHDAYSVFILVHPATVFDLTKYYELFSH